MSVRDASAELDVTPSRVRALMRARQLHGTKIGAVWVIDAASVEARKRYGADKGSLLRVRPMSARTAWAASILCDDPGAHTMLSQPERSRTLARLRHLAPENIGVVHDWLASRTATTRTFKASERDLDVITRASGVTRTGISAAAHYGLDLTRRPEAHIYAATEATLDRLIHDYWLIESTAGNLTVSTPAVPIPDMNFAPRLITAVDLTVRATDTRTRSAAAKLITVALASIAA